ncbi:MAG: methylmalonyl-CoA mutase family protein, partial [Acidimicrobiales bacterium]
ERIVVGVNAFTEGNDDKDLETLKITDADERRQRERLGAVRARRDHDQVHKALERLREDAADPSVNLMPALIDAARAYATVGEMMATMAEVFGRYVEVPTL